jgi:hypothetical protein
MSLADMINEGNSLFDQMCQDRHDKGAEKYGALKFMENNTLDEAMEEIVDLANYARYTFIKLYLLAEQLDAKMANEVPNVGPQVFSTGNTTFVATREKSNE